MPRRCSEFGVILAICAAVWFGLSAVLLDTVFHIAAPGISETLYRGFIDSANRSQVLGLYRRSADSWRPACSPCPWSRSR